MRRVARYVLTGVLAAGLAAPALPAVAQAPSPSTADQAQNPQRRTTEEISEHAFMARVTGRVTSVDPQSGKLTLDTVDGPMTVRFPPRALANVKQGDQVTVGVGLMEESPAASPSTSPAPSSPAPSPPAPSPGGSTNR